MNMDKFRVGDKVAYKHTGLFGWEKDVGKIDWCVEAGLILGNIYTVEKVGEEAVVLSEGVAYYLHEDHFELAEADLQERDLINELVEALEELTKCVYAGYRAGSPKFEDAMLYAAKAIKKAKEIS
jgi:hypothetical protein